MPTTVEAGVPGSDYTFWVALVVPSATPAAAVARLQLEAAKALATPELVERLARLGAEPMVMQSADFNAFLRGEVESAARIVKAADLKPQ
ncbi:MAG: tripartite tricarboxylate transporter substrate-binding protein [Rubrivivax sp.]